MGSTRQGDGRERRFRALYEAEHEVVLGYALRRATPDAAADVVAETFLVAWRRLEDVPEAAATRPWLIGVARRVLANQRRGDRRRARLSARLASTLPPPSAATATTEAEAAVSSALGRLGETDRELLQLVAWEGLTPTDVAIVFDVSPVTARSRLHRARARLRSELTREPSLSTHTGGDA